MIYVVLLEKTPLNYSTKHHWYTLPPLNLLFLLYGSLDIALFTIMTYCPHLYL